jgi:hypothetical protein
MISIMDKYLDKVDLSQALKLRYQHGLTYQAIADKFHVSPQAVHEKLKRFNHVLDNKPDIDAFRDLKSDFLHAGQLAILDCLYSLDKAEQKDLMLRQPSAMALWFNSLFNAGRLEDGKATSINLEVTVDLSRYSRNSGIDTRQDRDTVIDCQVQSLPDCDNR